jgi:hypothetical protein
MYMLVLPFYTYDSQVNVHIHVLGNNRSGFWWDFTKRWAFVVSLVSLKFTCFR